MGKIETPKYKGKLEGKDLENFIEKHSKYWGDIDAVEFQRKLRDGTETRSDGNIEETSTSTCNLQNVIARFFEITPEEVDMLKLLIQYKRELESDEGEGLSDDEYDDYEALKLWFENGL